MNQHLDPDEIAALALDHAPDHESPAPGARAHLTTCPDCRAEYESFARTVDVGRRLGTSPDLGSELPSPAVWAGIREGLDLTAAEGADDPLREPRRSAELPVAPIVGAPPTADDRPGVPETESETDGPAQQRSARRWWPIAAAAAVVGIVAGTAIGYGVAQREGPTESVIAEAALDPFPGWDASGRATVEESSDGVRSIVVDVDGTAPDDAVREVWLIRPDASGLVSLGLMDGSSTRFALPADIDLAEYPIVDVSAEPLDGRPAHSGDSIVRGELRRS